MKLYEIKTEYEQLLQAAFDYAEENEGVIPDDLALALNSVEASYEEKIHNCLLYYKNQDAEETAIKAEAQKLAARATAAGKRKLWMKKYLQSCCAAGVKCSFPDAAISWRKSKSVDIIDESKVPDEYCKIERTPKKKLIEAAIKAGENIEYASIVEKLNLQIK